MSIDLHDNSPYLAQEQHAVGMPTGSHVLDPGPYHQANALLRSKLPHYRVHVSVKTSWTHIVLTVIAVICFLIYSGTRFWYIISGKTASFGEQTTSVPYSWVVLVAEVALGFLGFYGHQTYWKQTTVYTALTADELEHLTEVCAPCCAHPVVLNFVELPGWPSFLWFLEVF